MPSVAVVIPTVGRDSLAPLLQTLASAPELTAVVVVFDRPSPTLQALAQSLGCRVVHGAGRGPAAARNAGWRAAPESCEWIAFLDDDVEIPSDWTAGLAADLAAAAPICGAIQGQVVVPRDESRPPTDDERRTLGLATALWITADMAYRRSVLVELGGFDERFPRAYREDSDLALRAVEAGYEVCRGFRTVRHPIAPGGFLASVRAQRGNADNALMRRKHGPRWREKVGEQPGRLPLHLAATACGLAAVGFAAAGFATGRRRRAAVASAAAWAALTGRFAAARIAPGPRTAEEIVRMIATSALIPPAATWHRLAGEVRARRPAQPRQQQIQAILFDRDDTLIKDVPYLADPEGVTPVAGAAEALRRARAAGLRTGIVSNQSGVARGLISPAQLDAVNSRVEQLLGPFDTWQVCQHGDGDGCECRKPQPGMIRAAAAELGVSVRACVMIGDTGADVEAALTAGAEAILVPTARTLPGEVLAAARGAVVAPDIAAAVALVLERRPAR
jgi:histidinol-phosphate phosphatase family protein